MNKFISIGLSPNLSNQDLQEAVKVLLQSDWWFDEAIVERVRDQFARVIDVASEDVYLTVSGRAALWEALRLFGVGQNDEVLLQAFTCVAVVNPVLWVSAKPVYVDIERETLNMDLDDLERKITDRSRAVIVQHTFGLPFIHWNRLRKVADRHNLLIIEDCAHALGAYVRFRTLQEPVGTLGDAAIFSFGRDKIVSSVFGGALIGNQKKTLPDSHSKPPRFVVGFAKASRRWVLKQLLHPVITSIVLATYNWWGLGKLIHWAARRLGILSKATSRLEKECGSRPNWIDRAYPAALAQLLAIQLNQLTEMNRRRAEVVQVYQDARISCAQTVASDGVDRVWLRYPVLVDDPAAVHRLFKAHQIIIGDWYDQVVGPKEVELTATGYQPGSCPVAEEVSSQVINLPCHPRMTLEDAQRVVGIYKKLKH